jgi:magnesium-transporting ATPase (P-type)
MPRPDASSPVWHHLSGDAVAEHWQTSCAEGLSEAEVECRRQTHGENRLTPKPGKGPLLRFALQFAQPLVLVLLLAGAVTAFLGEWVDSGVIFGVTLINAIIGFIQEGKAESALAALARSVASEVTVLREGEKKRLPSRALVPGDVVLLAAGDKVPADLRLFRAKEMKAMEAALTGESTASDKHAGTLPPETLLADRGNMAYAGTMVVSGQGAGITIATGDATETGRISKLMGETPDLMTPLTRKMAAFSNWLLMAIGALALFTFAVGLWRGESPFEMFMAAVALAVGAIPEGLPAAMTITLAIGVSRMAKRRAIIRKLPAVETLGSTTVICSDKTGTLTENAMTVREIRAGGLVFAVGGHGYGGAGRIECDGRPATATGALRETLVAGVLCNDARLVGDDRHPTVVGDPTEAALLVAARKAGFDERTLVSVFPRLDELPFDSARLTMATLHEIEGARVVYVKGAVEALLPACATMLDTEGAEQPVNPPEILEAAAQMARGGLRVLALARSGLEAGAILDHSRLGRRMVLLGLVGMIDPPRQRAHAAVRTCHAAGIRVKMITGDHPGTALAIARQLGIAGESAGAVTGRELAGLDDRALCRTVADVDVFARIEPEQKLRLVRALQAGGEVVAMTGDGVNDAPAVKQADIGIAMGRGGTEVAKEAAAMVLTDDNFATIEAAVEEGRGIYDNLVKFITWTIPTNAGEGLVILAAVFAGTALPITPLQILWINMTTAILLGLTLAFEPVERGIMLRRPRPPAAPVLDGVLVRRIVLVGLLMLAGAFGLFELALRQGSSLAEARTVAANVFVMVEIFYLFSCRSLAAPFWTVGPLANPWIWAGVGTMIVLQSIFTYVPVFNGVFGTAPIGLGEWGLILGFSALSMAVVELDKRIGATGRHAAAQAQ